MADLAHRRTLSRALKLVVRAGPAHVCLGPRDRFVDDAVVALSSAGVLRELQIGVGDTAQVLFGGVFDADQLVAGGLVKREQFIELQMDSHTVLVLALLDEKNHQEGDDSGSRIDNELPVFREVKDRTAEEPDADGYDRKAKRIR